MPIIGVCGRKGGSGKTTTAIHLGAELATRGMTVAVVDCDVQGSATHWAEPGNLPMPVYHMPLEADEQVAEWSKVVRAVGAAYIVLDSPPHLNAALGGVIGLADVAVIPCGPSGLDLIATGETVGLVREIRDARGDGRPRITLVPNRVDRRTASGRELCDALADMGEPVAPEVHYRTAFVDAFNAGQWVGAYAANTPAHREMKALADHVLSRLEELV
jgi:chromosome partitioning protein